MNIVLQFQRSNLDIKVTQKTFISTVPSVKIPRTVFQSHARCRRSGYPVGIGGSRGLETDWLTMYWVYDLVPPRRI